MGLGLSEGLGRIYGGLKLQDRGVQKHEYAAQSAAAVASHQAM